MERSLRTELHQILVLAGPLMAAQGGMMLMGVVDTMVVGHAGALDMAAVALGNAVCNTVMVFGLGAAMGIEPLVAQAHGAKEENEARIWLWQGLALALILSLPLTVITGLATLFFEPSGLSPELSERARAYVLARLPSVSLYCTLGVLRSYLSSRGHKWAILIAVVAANLVNLFLDLALVRGWFGLPKLGGPGTAYATDVSLLLINVVLAVSIYRSMKRGGGRLEPSYDARRVRRAFGLGWAIGAQATIETGVFMTVAWAIGKMGEMALAGHSIALTVGSLSFMMALGIATAATARVGFHIGAGSPSEARRSGLLAIGVGAAFMGACGLLCLTIPAPIARLFTNDANAIAAGIPLIMIAGAFALSDGIQTVSGGALRGAGDMRWPLWTHLGGYWFFGLPIGWALAHKADLGPAGYWWGLTAALTAIAVVLSLRFNVLSRRELTRI